MTWNTVDVLGISCTGNTAMKLAWKILNVIAMYRMGFWWVLYPFPCNVLAVYLPGTPALAPSVYRRLMMMEIFDWDKDVDRQLNHTKPAMRYSAALGSRLMARILEGEERVRVSRLVTLRQD